ncbi:MAG TPA: glutathione S-transferase family protein [bacterium]|nr:glutathione S-transferase family protein [bacterium]
MKLHASNRTPYGRKVRIVLAEQGLPYDRDTAGASQKPLAELAGRNPALRVPILEDGGRVLCESNLIIEYLLATYADRAADAPRPLLAPAVARAEHAWADRGLLGVLDALLEAAVNLRQLGMDGVTPTQSPYLQRHQQRIARILDWLEPRAQPEGLIPGWFSVQDVALVSVLQFGEHFDIFAWRGRPRLEALMARLDQRPSVAGTRPD